VTGFSAFDHAMMRRALTLAQRGLYTTTPNPRVGCVVTRGEAIIGEGWHERAGSPHAEVLALRGIDARGASVYVTLEPCNHHGRTPPCVPALVQAGAARVVAAMRDPNREAAAVAKRSRRPAFASSTGCSRRRRASSTSASSRASRAAGPGCA